MWGENAKRLWEFELKELLIPRRGHRDAMGVTEVRRRERENGDFIA